MKINTWFALLILISCSVLGCISGCVSTGVKPQTIDAIAAAVQPLAKNVVNAVLTKNPKYSDALLALAAGADAALNGGDLSVDNIRAFVETLALEYNLDRESKLLIASGIDDVLQFYRRTYGGTVIAATDPNVKQILSAFASGVRDGVAFFRALNASPTAQSDIPVRPAFGALGVPAIGRG